MNSRSRKPRSTAAPWSAACAATTTPSAYSAKNGMGIWSVTSSEAGGDANTPEKYRKWGEARMADLDRLLPEFEKYGIKVVIDLHSGPATMNEILQNVGIWTTEAQDMIVDLWREIARPLQREFEHLRLRYPERAAGTLLRLPAGRRTRLEPAGGTHRKGDPRNRSRYADHRGLCRRR